MWLFLYQRKITSNPFLILFFDLTIRLQLRMLKEMHEGFKEEDLSQSMQKLLQEIAMHAGKCLYYS